jgi:sacsin
MHELQGPALLQYDSAVFKDEDWAGLMSFGQGSKQLDPTKTGKFGLGFNSVYHLTECPQFISTEYYMAIVRYIA